MNIAFKGLVLLSCLLISCGNTRKQPSIEDDASSTDLFVPHLEEDSSFPNDAPEIMDSDVISSDFPYRLKGDTTIGFFHASYALEDNKDIVAHEVHYANDTDSVYRYWDRSFYLTLKYRDTILFSEKEFNKRTFEDIIPEEIIDDFEFTSFSIRSDFDETIVCHFNFCVIDTDWCYPIDLLIDKTGTITATLIDYGEMGED